MRKKFCDFCGKEMKGGYIVRIEREPARIAKDFDFIILDLCIKCYYSLFDPVILKAKKYETSASPEVEQK